MPNTRQSQISLVQRWFKVVRTEGIIHKWDLVDTLGITVSQYNQMANHVEHRLNDKDIVREKQFWKFLGSVPTETVPEEKPISQEEQDEVNRIMGRNEQ